MPLVLPPQNIGGQWDNNNNPLYYGPVTNPNVGPGQTLFLQLMPNQQFFQDIWQRAVSMWNSFFIANGSTFQLAIVATDIASQWQIEYTWDVNDLGNTGNTSWNCNGPLMTGAQAGLNYNVVTAPEHNWVTVQQWAQIGAHEIGHVMGLGDTYDDAAILNTIMYGTTFYDDPLLGQQIAVPPPTQGDWARMLQLYNL
jgi:hypothetical protein